MTTESALILALTVLAYFCLLGKWAESRRAFRVVSWEEGE